MKILGHRARESFTLEDLKPYDFVTDKALAEYFDQTAGLRNNNYRQFFRDAGHRIDTTDEDLTVKTVHHTFKKLDGGAWCYIGKCFAGETVERGLDFEEKGSARTA